VEAGNQILFMVGASASAVMLFGLSYLFGVAHTNYVAELIRRAARCHHDAGGHPGLVLTLCGFFFRLRVFPFHYWAPDVYQGRPTR